ncbi:MAG: protein-(glutamine-N5) methyltransferase, release factor-specific [Thiotrichales bacterium 12-47-6]|nr:MAG: protein-(glutamine-N5) methyltransferase, release factor-specific [Thiotrichales bacterium 12-47-6]
MNISQTLTWLRQQIPPEEATREAELMLCRATGLTRTQLRTHPEKDVSATQQAQLSAWIQRRLQGEPLAYILGDAEFYGLTLSVTSDTLIPRQDTELLVDAALELIPERAPWTVLDMGTGSGAIAIAIAHHRPIAQVTALDASKAALAVAQDNACALRLPSIRFIHSDWFSALGQQRFDVIISNPPYIAQNDPHLQATSLPYEPISALTSGVDGLDDIRLLVQQAPKHLNSDGWLLLEHGYDQGAAVRHLMQSAGFSAIATHRDYGNNDRITLGQLNQT